MNLTTIAATAGLAAALSSITTWLSLRHSRSRQLLAHPEWRSSHAVPTPSGCGVGLVTTIVALLVFSAVTRQHLDTLWLAAGMAAAGALGYRDDGQALPARLKMAGIVLSALLCCGYATLHSVRLPGGIVLPFGLLALPLTLFWYVGFANIFNFMDGINGISGVTVVLSCAALALLTPSGSAPVFVTSCTIAIAASCAFVPWNFPKARLFMGDAGSLPLGLMVAALSTRASEQQLISFPATILVLGPYVFDTTFTLLRRARRGERLSQAHREHLYQRISRLAQSHTVATLLYGALTMSCTLLAWLYQRSAAPIKFATLLGGLALMSLVAVFVTGVERKRNTANL